MLQVREGTLVLPFADTMLARTLVLAGLGSDAALSLAAEVRASFPDSGGDRTVDVDEVRAATAQLLASCGETAALRRLRVRWWLRGGRRPVVIAIGGTSGVGKSTISNQVAHVLGIEAVISTDLVRAVLRATLHPQLIPALSESSFSAEKMFRSNLAGNRLLAAFEQQATVVAHASVALVRRAIKEGLQLVVNGVHIVPGLADVPADWPYFPYLLTVPDLTDHERRFEARFASSDRDPQRYKARLLAIRELDEYLVGFSRDAGVPVIESVELQQTVSDLLDVVVLDLEKEFAIP